MLIKSVLVLLSITQLAFTESIDAQKAIDYQKLSDCQALLCAKLTKSADPKSEFRACQVGCNYLVEKADKCADGCTTDYAGAQNLIDACQKSCKFTQPIAMENNVVSNVAAEKPSLSEVIDKLKNEKPTDDSNGVFSNLENLFNKLVNPNGDFDDTKDPSDPIILSINNKDENDDSSSDSSSEEKMDKKLDTKIDDNKPEGSTGVSTGFSFKDMFQRAFKMAKDKLSGGNFIYTAKMLENGTIVETIQEPDSLPNVDETDDETPFRILNTLFGDKHNFMSLDNDHRHGMMHSDMMPHGVRPNGLQPNWKGVPLPIGKPIIEPLDDTNPHFYEGYRMCRPIKFHLSTLCHDLNNFFTCASMRTGLPRWFFLSLMLLCSFFLIWLGIFMFSMIRRMKRQERIIHLEEDQLPLYKDIVIEEKLPPTYQAEPLPEKIKLETV